MRRWGWGLAARAGGLGLVLLGAATLAVQVGPAAVPFQADAGPAAPGAAASAGIVPAVGGALQELPPGVTPEMVERGREIFVGPGLCHTCHGRSGEGREGLGADLTDREWTHGDGSFEYLLDRIDRGVSAQASTSGVPMPPRGGSGISDEEVEAVAAYVWTLSRSSPDEDAGAAPEGDAEESPEADDGGSAGGPR